jgi:hypothetical protein
LVRPTLRFFNCPSVRLSVQVVKDPSLRLTVLPNKLTVAVVSPPTASEVVRRSSKAARTGMGAV